MTIEQFQNVFRAEPFKPFRLHLADGRSLDVEHPEFVARTPGGRTLIVTSPDESFEVIDLLLVTSLEVPNGRKHKQKRTR